MKISGFRISFAFTLSFVFSLFFSRLALAFPEYVRHHYFSCTACHVSPSGGGVLNGYGRTISTELLSTWGSQEEVGFLQGLVPVGEEDKLFFGGNLRSLQVHVENSQFKRGFPVRMQAGLEMGYRSDSIATAIFVGKLSPDGNIWTPYSPRYWVSGQLTETTSLRAGRYLPNFGLNIPQHRAVTREGLGFDQGTERDTVEVQRTTETLETVLGYSQSVETDDSVDPEKALHFQINAFLAEQHRVGVSLWMGDRGPMKIRKISLHGVLGYSEHFYQLAEMAQLSEANSNEIKGKYAYTKLGYEVHKGIHLLLDLQYKKSNDEDVRTEAQQKGVGFAFYPRPHFELEGLFAKRRDVSDAFRDYDYGYLQMHYYF